MQPLAYTTSKISTKLLFSAIVRASDKKSSGDVRNMDLNLEALPSIVLSCTALEAFVNEISSLSHSFLFEFEQRREVQQLEAPKHESIIGISWSKCKEIAELRDDSKSGSFYDKYKLLLKKLGIENPSFLPKLSDLENIRHDIVHFKMLDIPIVENSDGVIVSAQESPEIFKHLKGYSIKGFPVVAADGNDGSAEWTLRISTNAMVIWCIDSILEAIIYVIDSIPNGSLKDFILRAYAAREKSSFVHVFQAEKSEVALWTNKLFGK